MNKPRTPLRITMELTEDCQGGAAEMRTRLGTVWPLDGTLTTRIKARCLALEGDLRELRRALDRAEAAA